MNKIVPFLFFITLITFNGCKPPDIQENSYLLSIIITGEGEVALDPDTDIYKDGTVTTLTAVPGSGWYFAGWTGDAAGADNPLMLTMDESKSVTAVFDRNTYSLTISTEGSGTVLKNPDQTSFSSYSEVELTAAAGTNWNFSHWSVDASGSENPMTVVMDSEKSITAVFTEDSYILNINTNGGGTVSKSPDQASYTHDSIAVLTPIPDYGWSFDSWSGDASGSENPLTLVMDSAKSITALFTEVSYVLTTNTIGSGSVSRSSNQSIYPSGSLVELTPTPDDGWSFDSWSGDVTGSDNPLSITMDAAKSVTAVFIEASYSLTVSTDGSGSVAINPDQTSYSNNTVHLTPEAGNGWNFSHWEGDAEGYENPLSIYMDSEKSITAVFTEDSCILTTFITGIGSVNRSPDQASYITDAVVELTPIPEDGWSFDSWTGDASGSDNPLSLTMDQAKTVTANFTPGPYILTIEIYGEGSGTVTRTPEKESYAPGDTVVLTPVVSSDDWIFSGWYGDIYSTDNPLNLTMYSSLSIIAEFKPPYDLMIQTIGSGSVQQDPFGFSYFPDSAVELTATPDTGWSFKEWSGDATGSQNPLTITMNTGKSITAEFIQDTYTLTTSGVSGSGTLNRNPDLESYPYGTTIELTAVPEAGWGLSSWSGDATGSENPLTVTMDRNRTINTIFIETDDEVSDILVTTPESGEVVLSWTNPAGFFENEVWYGTEGSADIEFTGTIDTAGTAISGLANGITYTFIIKTVDSGTSSDGMAVSAVPSLNVTLEHCYTYMTSTGGLIHDTVRDIYIDTNDSIYIGTDGGLNVYDGTTWSAFTEADGLGYNQIGDIFVDKEGLIFAGTYGGGVSIYNESAWSTFTSEDGLPNNYIYSIALDSNGVLYAGIYHEGVSMYDGSTWTNYTAADGLAGEDTQAVFVDSNDILYVGNAGGLSIYDGTTWTIHNESDGLPYNYVDDIHVDSRGNIYVGTPGGIGVYDGTVWIKYTTADGLADNRAESIYVDSFGVIYACTTQGLCVFDKASWKTYTTADGLENNHVTDVCPNSENLLFVGTFGGGLSEFSVTVQ